MPTLCRACGREFSLWGRLTGDAKNALCQECEREGKEKLELLIRCAPSAADLNRLIQDFRNMLHRYATLGGDVLHPLKQRFTEGVATLVSAREDFNSTEMDALADVIQSFGIRTPSIGASITRINARCALMRWDAGEIPINDCAGLLLGEDEACHWEEGAELFEQRTRRHYVGGYGGVSIRVARGIRVHTGAFKGHPIETTDLLSRGWGTLHVTSERLCFTGSHRAIEIPFKKIISVLGFEDGFKVFRKRAVKPTIFRVTAPELTLQILAYATPAPND